eukprot:TRINITY_DN22751_c0_g1_i1.p1 TRINITY_DN22751_c0_g1~~TRINITY_DN22751_c0_g1_i1.p1  ORF type:complete len:151 (-),score=28.80 TRINITY_DN22751_c0_g1_i1:160-585(-)
MVAQQLAQSRSRLGPLASRASRLSADVFLLLSSGEWTYVDLRTPEEQEEYGTPDLPSFSTVTSHMPGGCGRVFDREAWLAKLQEQFPCGAKLVLACRSGVRSKDAWRVASAAGYQNLLELDDGFVGWEQRRYPIRYDDDIE